MTIFSDVFFIIGVLVFFGIFLLATGMIACTLNDKYKEAKGAQKIFLAVTINLVWLPLFIFLVYFVKLAVGPSLSDFMHNVNDIKTHINF